MNIERRKFTELGEFTEVLNRSPKSSNIPQNLGTI